MADTIPARFARQALACAQKPLFLAKRAGAYHSITWQQASEDVRALSAFLLHQQISPGDRVIILSENRPEWAIADLAIQSVGAWTVPIYATLLEEGVRAICTDAQPAVCIVSTGTQAQKIQAATRGRITFRAMIVMESGALSHPPFIAWSDALATGREQLQPDPLGSGIPPARLLRSPGRARQPRRLPLQPDPLGSGIPRQPRRLPLQGVHEELERRLSQLQPDATATLIYTSGTTGEPKGVMLSHRNFLSNVDACLQVIPVQPGEVHLSFLPLCHVFERMAGWYLVMTVGGTIAYAEDMETVPKNMAEVRPTMMLGVPRFFEKLYARVREATQQGSLLKRRLAGWALSVGQASAACQLAGRPVPILLQLQRVVADRLVFAKFKARLGGRLRFFIAGSAPLSKEIGEFFYGVGVTILEGYGLTETSPVITVNRLDHPQFGSVGQAIPGVEVRIAEDGEILTRGPHIMQGYYRKPEATAETIVDGWLHTGDIGHLDTDGTLFITDRKKDLIKTAGGKFVPPQKLENLFVMDPYISQAFVFGDTRPFCVALIVPDMEQLRRYAQQQGIAGGSAQELVRDPKVAQFYWDRVDAKQQGLARYEQIKRIALLDQEFSLAAGELTPTLKAKRSIIATRYAAILDGLYETTLR